MKKIVGTILAASLALTAFAAEPAANFVMSEFTGSMDFGWTANFADSNDVKMGMYNKPDYTLKFGFVDGGDKVTTGDGIWGELKIAADGTSVKNGNVLLPGQKDNGTGTMPTPTGKKDEDKFFMLDGLFPVPSVKVAKIHFVDGDFSAALNIMAPDLAYGEFKAPAATGSTVQANKIDANGSLSNGFAIEVGMKDLFALNFKLKDNGVSSIKNNGKKIGLAFDVSLKAIENLDLMVAGAFNFGKGEEFTGIAANAGYKFGITDTLYVKPGVAYTMGKAKADQFAANNIEAGVLLGWGAADQEPGFKWVADKTTEGFSVGVSNNLNFEDKRTNKTELVVGLYDQSLFNLLGLDGFGTLKTGLVNTTSFESYSDKSADTSKSEISNTFGAGVRYANDNVGPAYINLGFDITVAEGSTSTAKTGTVSTKTTVDPYTSTAWSARIGTKTAIDNTDLYVDYSGEYDGKKGVEKITKHEVSIGTKISF